MRHKYTMYSKGDRVNFEVETDSIIEQGDIVNLYQDTGDIKYIALSVENNHIIAAWINEVDVYETKESGEK